MRISDWSSDVCSSDLENHLKLLEGGPRKVSPVFVPGSIANMIAGNLAIRYGFKGPNFAVTTACTTGAHNIGLAAQQIELGYADVMLAGGAEKADRKSTRLNSSH